MVTYKLFRIKNEKLYPMFVFANKEMPMGVWLDADVGELTDATHVKSRIGPLALRPGFHSTEVPFTDWIGIKGKNGQLLQRPDTVWCECEVEGNHVEDSDRVGSRTIPDGWYYFKTKAGQKFPWVLSDRIRIVRMLDHEEVKRVCRQYGVEAQPTYQEKR